MHSQREQELQAAALACVAEEIAAATEAEGKTAALAHALAARRARTELETRFRKAAEIMAQGEDMATATALVRTEGIERAGRKSLARARAAVCAPR